MIDKDKHVNITGGVQTGMQYGTYLCQRISLIDSGPGLEGANWLL